MNRKARRIPLGLFSWLLLVGIGTTVGLTIGMVRDQRLNESGRLTLAKVTGQEQYRSGSEGNTSIKYRYYLEGDGHRFSIRGQRTPTESTTLPVVYDPDDPSVYRLADETGMVPVARPTFGIIVTLVGSVGVLITLSHRRRERPLEG